MRTLWKIPKINVKDVGNIIKHVNIKEYDLINYKDHRCILHASCARVVFYPGSGYSQSKVRTSSHNRIENGFGWWNLKWVHIFGVPLLEKSNVTIPSMRADMSTKPLKKSPSCVNKLAPQSCCHLCTWDKTTFHSFIILKNFKETNYYK
jgi:hypothetical protein